MHTPRKVLWRDEEGGMQAVICYHTSYRPQGPYWLRCNDCSEVWIHGVIPTPTPRFECIELERTEMDTEALSSMAIDSLASRLYGAHQDWCEEIGHGASVSYSLRWHELSVAGKEPYRNTARRLLGV